MRKINKVILHCAATPEGKDFTVEQIDKWHKQRGFKCIGYHWVIYRDGTIKEGRKESEVGAHCTNQNKNSIGICYVGGCDSTGKKAKDTRTLPQKQAMFVLVDTILQHYNLSIEDVYCHNQFASKACPSFKIEDFKKEFEQWKKEQV